MTPRTEDIDDEVVIRYLLGSLSAEETEQLDERSIADDGFAARLKDAENDLIDSYVRGNLPPATEAQFRSVYVSSNSSPGRREKVRFAQTLLLFQRRDATKEKAVTAGPAKSKEPAGHWTFFSFPRLIPQWGLAAAAALALLVVAGYLSISNRRLRERIDRADADRASFQQRAQQLESQMKNAASAQTAKSEQPLDHLRIAAFVLAPSVRGDTAPPSIVVSPETDLVVLKLGLEGSDFAQYRAALEDSGTRKILWQSSTLKPQTEASRETVSFAFPANLVKQQGYVLQLSGIRGNGAAELVSSYPFRAIRK